MGDAGNCTPRNSCLRSGFRYAFSQGHGPSAAASCAGIPTAPRYMGPWEPVAGPSTHRMQSRCHPAPNAGPEPVNSLARPCRPPFGEDCIQCVVRGTAVLWPGNWLGAVVLGTRHADPHNLLHTPTCLTCGDCTGQRRLYPHTNRQGLVAAAPYGLGTPDAHGGENRQ